MVRRTGRNLSGGPESLFETLLLNFVLFLSNVPVISQDDYAPWERKVPSADTCQREPTGPVDLLTWQSRRIRLVPSEDGSCVRGVIISYGDILIPANKQRFEMMTGWQRDEKLQRKLGVAVVPLQPVAPDTARALWRGLPSLLAVADDWELRPGIVRWMGELQDEQSSDDWRLNVRVVCQGVATTKNIEAQSKMLLWTRLTYAHRCFARILRLLSRCSTSSSAPIRRWNSRSLCSER